MHSQIARALVSVLLALSLCAGAAQAVPKSTGSAKARLVEANTGFGIELFKDLVGPKPKNNVFISPLSLSLALSMAYNGASGDTAKAMAKTLGYQGLTLSEVNRSNSALISSLQAKNNNWTSISIANSLWADQTRCPLLPEFAKTSASFYKAKTTNLDFSNPKSPGVINSWIRQKTAGRIDNVIGELRPDEFLVLANSMRFTAPWLAEFPKGNTKKKPFTLLDGRKKQVPMMSCESERLYYRGDGFQAVRLPYSGEDVDVASMYVFLPDKRSNLGAFYKTLTSARWAAWKSSFRPADVCLVLPRFQLRYKAEEALKKSLASRGMGVAFDLMTADFGKMVRPGTRSFLSRVIEDSFLSVNEKGTEAAAASMAIVALGVGEPGPPLKKVDFVVDRPFFIVIRDGDTGSILFLGSVVDPS